MGDKIAGPPMEQKMGLGIALESISDVLGSRSSELDADGDGDGATNSRVQS